MKLAATTVAVLLCSGSFAANAGQPATTVSQVRQADNLAVKEWHSPITFDVDAGWLKTLPFKESATLKDLPSFYCDGVSLDRLKVEKHLKSKTGDVELEIGFHLHARRQKDDKVVALEFVLLNGEQRLLLGRLEDLEVNEGDSLSDEVEYKISKDVFDAYTADGSSPQLRVSMIVVDN